jgi:hypothetical protein
MRLALCNCFLSSTNRERISALAVDGLELQLAYWFCHARFSEANGYQVARFDRPDSRWSARKQQIALLRNAIALISKKFSQVLPPLILLAGIATNTYLERHDR